MSGLFIKYSIAEIISQTPALSSEPSKVFPSVVMIVWPLYCFISLKYSEDKMIFFFLFNVISPPS